MSKHTPKFTPWVPGELRPERVGVYQRDIGIWKADYAYWDGLRWHSAWGTIRGAEAEPQTSGYQCGDTVCGTVCWCGLASQPRATGA